MSISDQIKRRIAELHDHELHFLPPRMPGEAAVREMFVSSEVASTVLEPFPRNWTGQRHMEFRGVLDSFSRYDCLPVSETPYQAGQAVLARIDPVMDEIWDIRCLAPNARIRCFGAFGGKDLFIALTWQYREDLTPQEEFNNEIDRCKNEWRRLFDPIPRFKGRSVDDYISNFYPV